MSFPVNSTLHITPPCKRFAEHVMQDSKVDHFILYAGVWNRRHISGSSSWSQHAYGNAVDLMAHEEDLYRIAHNAVMQATENTQANDGKHVPIAHVIWRQGDDGIWTPSRGWHYFGGYHPPTHVHVDFNPQKTGTPPS